ncbi:MAG: PAS domain S-box protein [Candidatus Delongbacteria bacterium]|nr:PAS domain S-box protein [Candidatus Delongbacteria bacterium]
MSGMTQVIYYAVDFLLIGALVWLLILRKKLKENERSQTRLVQSIGEGISIVDEDEVFIFANRAAENILEVEEGELIGKNLLAFLSPVEIEKINSQTAKRRQGLTDRYELNIVTARGNTKVIEVTVSPNYDDRGRFVSSYGVFRDITEFKNAQIKLKESEELFKALLNNVPLPIFYKSIEGKYLGCNRAFEKFIGKTEVEIIGKTVYDLAPGDIAQVYSERDLELFVNGGKQVYEWKYMKPDGEVRNIIFHKAALTDYFGNITGLIGAIVDITDVKRYETILHEQQGELKRSNKDLEQFAYIVSHDLQEPLRMVSGFTDLLKRKHGGSLNEEANKYIDFAVDGAKNMQTMIQGLLAYSRVTTQGGTFENVALNDIVEGALKNLAGSVKESGAEIMFSSLPVVHGDRFQLISVFQNLIGNAIKFRKPGEKPVIEISGTVMEKGNVRIRVKDNGIGFDPRHKDNIFIIFHRLHSQSKYEGTGIGLSIVKKIVERHGGTISVESEKNRGTEFMLTVKGGKNNEQ